MPYQSFTNRRKCLKSEALTAITPLSEGIPKSALATDYLPCPGLALSIRQPWAGVIIGGAKDVENRTWRTHYRGPVLLHAGKAAVDEDDMRCVKEILRANKDTLKLGPCALSPDGSEWPRELELPRGGIVGVVDIVDCVDHHASPWFFGPFGFVLANARPLPFFPCRGALGLFAIEYPEALWNLAKATRPNPAAKEAA